MTWEALNNISDDNDRNLVIVVNDNGRSYAPTIGGMARYLNRVRTADTYRSLHRGSDQMFRKLGPAARAVYRGVRGGTHGFLSRFIEQRRAVLEPRHQVPRPGRRPRSADAHRDPRAREGSSAHRSSSTRSPRRAAASSPPSTTRPTSSTPSARSTRSPARPSAARAADRRGPTSSPTSSSRSARSATTSSR